jgi:hypothetical protein
MAVKLHRCSTMWAKIEAHPCWRVQKALEHAGIEYVVVAGPVRRSRRSALVELTGQRFYPVIEFDDGSVYREHSLEMAARIRAGRLMDALRRHPHGGGERAGAPGAARPAAGPAASGPAASPPPA